MRSFFTLLLAATLAAPLALGLTACAAPLGTLGAPPPVFSGEERGTIGTLAGSASFDDQSVGHGASAALSFQVGDHFAVGPRLHYAGLRELGGDVLHSVLYTADLLFYGEHAGFRLSLGLFGGGGPEGPGAAYGLVGGQLYARVGRAQLWAGTQLSIVSVLARRIVDTVQVVGEAGASIYLFDDPALKLALDVSLEGGRRKMTSRDALDLRTPFLSGRIGFSMHFRGALD